MGNRMGVYCFINLLNGRRYVGSSKSINSRYSSHIRALVALSHENSELQADWNQFGPEGFSFVVLELVTEVGLLRSCESRYIKVLSGTVKLYNSYGTGQFVMSDARRLQAANLANRLWATPEFREKMSQIGRSKKPAISGHMKRLWGDPVWAAQQKEKIAKGVLAKC